MQRLLAVLLILAATVVLPVDASFAQTESAAEAGAVEMTEAEDDASTMDVDAMMAPEGEDAMPVSEEVAEEVEALVEETATEMLAPDTEEGDVMAPVIDGADAGEAAVEEMPVAATEDAAPVADTDPCVAILEDPESAYDARIDCVVKPIAAKLLSFVFAPLDTIMPDSWIVKSEESQSKSNSELIAGIPMILLWLVFAALFFTFYFGFINLRLFVHAIDLVRGKHDKHSKGDGEINRFQALMTSLSGTVGLGNIAGVAVAISVGGPGAMVWMIIMGFFGMSAKFTECALGVKYRHITHDNELSGGPMYFMRDGFKEKGKTMGTVGLLMGYFFAVCCVGGSIGGGNMFQANQAYQQVLDVTGGDASVFAGKGWMFGVVLALLVGVVIIGGIKSIAQVASKIVPLMAVVYLGAGIVVLGMNISQIPEAFAELFRAAFAPTGDHKAMYGGLLGALIQGVRRAAFSNEAGIGSAAIAHAAVKTDSAVSQGVVAMLGPFIDTIVICTMTALVIVVSGAYLDSTGMEGVKLTSRAFGSAISWFPYLLAVAVCLFAFSTMISWSYYGLKAFTYIFGESRFSEMTYKVIYCMFVVVGAAANLENVIGFTDAMIFAMAVPNIIGLYILAPGLKRDVKAYIAELKSGKNSKA